MQKGHRIDFQTQITDFKELEKEFAKSLHSNSILVLDIYTDWVGSCKVVVPYFQKAYLESNEFCPLCFLCVNSDLVIQSLENANIPLSLYNTKKVVQAPQQVMETPTKKKQTNLNDSLFADLISPSSSVNNSIVLQEGQSNETPMASISPIEKSDTSISNLNISNIENLSKSMDSLEASSMRSSKESFPDTDRRHWVPQVASVMGKSCPRFLFYKGGKLMDDVTGVNISRINSILKTLIDIYIKEKEKTGEMDNDDQPLNDESMLSDRVNVDSHLDDSTLDF